MSVYDLLKSKIKEIIKNKYNTDINIEIDRPPENVPGDFAINIAFQLAKKQRKSPMDIAKEFSEYLREIFSDINVYVIKPGYINIEFSNDFYKDELKSILEQKERYFYFDKKEVKINLEFVSANPVGPLNIVSGRAASYGGTLANLLKKYGYSVTKEYYINDYGRQMDLFGLSLKKRYFELFGEETVIPEDGYKGEYVKELAKKLKEEKGDYLYKKYKNISDEELLSDKNNDFRDYGLKKMVAWHKFVLKEFGVEFDEWFYESDLYKKKTVEITINELKKNGFLYEKEGALWLKTKDLSGDDKDRVIKKSDGTYTYFASDIAYLKNKIDRGFDKLIIILGPDHHGYVKRLKAGIKALNKNDEMLDIIILQQVNLVENGRKVKMSKREGKIITLDDLIDEVGKDAARYYFLMRNYNSHLDFDIKLAKEQSDKNPVYYVQYAYARICNIFNHAEEKGVIFDEKKVSFDMLNKEEKDIIISILNMKKVIKETAEKYTPSILINELYALVSKFHSFYNKFRVVSNDSVITNKRLLILKILQLTLKELFKIIDITPLERM